MNKIVVLLCVLFVLISLFPTDTVFGQEQSEIQETEVVQERGITSFWELTRYAKEFRWPLFLTLIIGIIIAVKKFLDLLFEWKTVFRFQHTNFSRFRNPEQFERFVGKRKSMASSLILLLLKTLQVSPGADKFTEELEKFTQLQKQHFLTFQNRMSFWSDTAGALGLLGTVWGMFITFFRGTMEQQEILSGMGIALITTLMGLIISIILNFISTEVSGYFNKILKKQAQISDKLWLWVLHKHPAQSTSGLSNSPVKQKTEPVQSDKKEVAEDCLYEFGEVSGNRQKVAVNHRLKTPIAIRLFEISGGKRRKMGEEPVQFTIDDGMGVFSNGKEQIVIRTNSSGKAETSLTASNRSGFGKVIASHPTLDIQPMKFEIEIVSSRPVEIRIKNGNHQTGPTGQVLSQPLIAEVVDSNAHPVPHSLVEFRVLMGNGSFSNRKPTIQITTDEHGAAAAKFCLGNEAGFNSIEAGLPGQAKKQIVFEAMGQS